MFQTQSKEDGQMQNSITRAAITRAAIVMGLSLGVATTTSAEEFTTSISGYGTVGGTFTSDKNVAYRQDPQTFTGASNTLDIGLDSRIGVQAVFDFGNGFSVTAQELAKQREDQSFDLGTEWLYLEYQPTQDFKLRLGRVVVATFLLSDSINVGYAATWFLAPNELYTLQPFQNLDGGQVLWHHGFGPVTVGLQTSYGNAKQNFQVGAITFVANLKYLSNTSATIEYGDFLVRVAQTKSTGPISVPVTATDSLNINSIAKFTSPGIQYDNGKAIVMGEWSKAAYNTPPGLPLPLSGTTTWYMAGGWRFGKFTPMVMYGKFDAIHSLTAPEGKYGTWTGILRYDIARNIALKAQVSRPEESNAGYWITAVPTSNKRVNVYSFGTDFVF
jgi:hypothetical protein